MARVQLVIGWSACNGTLSSRLSRGVLMLSTRHSDTLSWTVVVADVSEMRRWMSISRR